MCNDSVDTLSLLNCRICILPPGNKQIIMRWVDKAMKCNFAAPPAKCHLFAEINIIKCGLYFHYLLPTFSTLLCLSHHMIFSDLLSVSCLNCAE